MACLQAAVEAGSSLNECFNCFDFFKVKGVFHKQIHTNYYPIVLIETVLIWCLSK